MTKYCPPAVFGRWRITDIEGWDAGYIDLVSPGYIQFDQDRGQAEFGAMQLSLDCWFGHAGATFNFQGSDEGTEVSGDGDAELETTALCEESFASTMATTCHSSQNDGECP